MSDTDPDQPSLEPEVGDLRRPGHELGMARQRAGITRESMAETLHLPFEQLEALEVDDYSRLPPPAYVRGYLRAYARAVDLDGDDLVAQFDATVGKKGDPDLKAPHGATAPGRANASKIGLLIVLLVVLIGAAAWWWQTRHAPGTLPILAPDETAGQEAPGDDTEPAGEAAPPESESVADAAPDESGSAGIDESGSADNAATESTASAESTLEAGSGEPADGPHSSAGLSGGDEAGSEAQQVAGLDTSSDVSEGTAETETDEPSGDSDAPASEAAQDAAANARPEGPLATDLAAEVGTSAAASGPDRLILRIDGRSWLEIYDARGRQLAYTLYSGDRPVTLNGWAPFDVFLGNSRAVELEFNGDAVDSSAFVRNDQTARFLLDGRGARNP